jgi:hypothetical protein
MDSIGSIHMSTAPQEGVTGVVEEYCSSIVYMSTSIQDPESLFSIKQNNNTHTHTHTTPSRPIYELNKKITTQ